MQDTKDPRAFTIVERYLHESSQKYARHECVPSQNVVSTNVTTGTTSRTHTGRPSTST